jgi:hypothetical protein
VREKGLGPVGEDAGGVHGSGCVPARGVMREGG